MNVAQLSPAQRTAFFKAVWNLVRQIPAGKVSTYGQIAALVLAPAGVSFEDFKFLRARWVGQAMAECPAKVPWQRVINSEGKISTRPGADLQRQLLEAEGVAFDIRQRVNLEHFGWEGPK
ncbi:MAG TPA: MGMT family protein [Anaerolineaceae bacterium]|jgi:methylated-DNA-protein-cysteine methyltransferase related protein